jgi:hypothetical protein
MAKWCGSLATPAAPSPGRVSTQRACRQRVNNTLNSTKARRDKEDSSRPVCPAPSAAAAATATSAAAAVQGDVG